MRGLGYEIAKVYLKNWFQVIWISGNKPDLDIIHLKTDLLKEWDIEKTTNIIKKEYSDFLYLINCAWIISIENFWKIDYKNTDNLLKINTIAPIIITS